MLHNVRTALTRQPEHGRTRTAICLNPHLRQRDESTFPQNVKMVLRNAYLRLKLLRDYVYVIALHRRLVMLKVELLSGTEMQNG